MKVFKKKTIIKMVFCCIVTILAALFGIFFVFSGDSFTMANDVLAGFQQGLILAMGVLSLINFMKLSAAVKEEKKLQMLFNKENDERQIYIRKKAGMPMMMFTSGAMILAGVIAGYFNETVFFTLVIAAICQLTVGAAIKVFYMIKLR